MKAFIIAATAVALTSGALLAAPAEAAPYKGYYGKVTAGERAMILRSKVRLNAVKRRVYADGKVSTFERMRLGTAQRRHAARVARMRHN